MEASQKAHPILLTLIKIQRKYQKDYSYPTQKRICELMGKYQPVRKSVPTLNRWMRVIEDSKYLKRKRRIKRHPEYGIVFKSTLYKITIKGLRLLSQFGVDVANELAGYAAWLNEISPKSNEENGSQKAHPKHPKKLNQILNQLGAKFIT